MRAFNFFKNLQNICLSKSRPSRFLPIEEVMILNNAAHLVQTPSLVDLVQPQQADSLVQQFVLQMQQDDHRASKSVKRNDREGDISEQQTIVNCKHSSRDELGNVANDSQIVHQKWPTNEEQNSRHAKTNVRLRQIPEQLQFPKAFPLELRIKLLHLPEPRHLLEQLPNVVLLYE
jgi:hypothetical protein